MATRPARVSDSLHQRKLLRPGEPDVTRLALPINP